MTKPTIIRTSGAPEAIGPYSQAVTLGNLVFTAGQIPLDPASGDMVEGDVAVQAERVFRNLEAVLHASGTSFDFVLKTTVFLRDLEDFAAMNAVYSRYFSDHKPARSTVEVSRLPRDARVEIELIAAIPSGAQ
jgi:2-iminobutanoate/2-iminopropanoate deaminase